jgi:signal transduction histidine kinase
LEVRKPSPLWLVIAAMTGLLAVGIATTAYGSHLEANTPIGEGELFVRDAEAALSKIQQSVEPTTLVRRVRNDLRIEAVSFVDREGTIIASTSPNLQGSGLSNDVLAFGHQSGRFVAVAAPISREIAIDGVTEWLPGDVLYRVLQPASDGALLLDYNISELLARRSRDLGISSATVRLTALAALFAAIGGAALVGRSRTARHNREVAREQSLLRRHAEALTEANVELTASRQRAEEALELAEEKNRVRAEFVLMINHELRTPLTAVVTGADLLRSDPEMPAASRDQILDAMVTDGSRLEEMIDQMLVVARIENRGLNIEFAAIDAAAVCSEVVAGHPVLNHTAAHPEPLPPVWTDKMTLTQLLHSLVDNAITHGATEVELSCRTDLPFEPQLEVGGPVKGGVVFVITDNGPGIDPDFLPRVFEKYEKDSDSPGTGLGLYLARLMVEALGGSIAVSTSAAGTTMAISVETAGHPALVWASS